MALTFPTWGLYPHTLSMGPGLHLSTSLDLLSLPELHCRCICVQFRHSHAWPWALMICTLSHRLNSQLDLRPASSPWTCLMIWGKLATRVEPNYHPCGLSCLPLLGTVGLDPGWWGPCPASCVIAAGEAGPCCTLIPALQLMTHRSHLSKGDTVN